MWTEKCERNEVGEMRVRRRDARIKFFALGIFAAVFLFTFLTQHFKKLDDGVEAASLANFDPGYIISDYQMGNYNSMSEAEIQAFLTAKNSCSNTNYNTYLQLSANTKYKWHWENGHFVCLSEELFGDGEIIGSGDTAAHIIWQAAQDYKINPQVLLVLLQKETGLITDKIPNDGDYRKATGYGCPDTAPCSSQYYGFKNQIRKAAALFRTVLDGGWTNYPLGANYVQYNPNPDCGGSVVNIRSLATSALYRYTPYQPNEGALAAGYGTAYCGAYGNRNFYLYFEDWFGGVTQNMKWIEMETPRYMTVSKKTFYYDLIKNQYTDVVLNENTIDFYNDKTFISDGRMCLRTEDDKNNDKDRCVLYDDLREVNWVFNSMDAPRYMESTNESMIINLNTRTNIDRPKNYEFYDQKVFLPNGDMCLRRKGDNGATCVIYSTLKEVKYKIYDMDSPRYLTAKNNIAEIIDSVRNSKVGYINQGEKRYFNKKIILPDNDICLLINENDEHKCVRFNELSEMWVEMENPRVMQVTVNSYKINAVSLKNNYEVVLMKGLQRKFVEKRYLSNGEWCLQTEYDYERGTNDCILYKELGEL